MTEARPAVDSQLVAHQDPFGLSSYEGRELSILLSSQLFLCVEVINAGRLSSIS